MGQCQVFNDVLRHNPMCKVMIWTCKIPSPSVDSIVPFKSTVDDTESFMS